MVPFTVRTHIAAPREAVFDFVADLAARVAFTDHYLEEFRLTRPRAAGVGAAARFRVRGEWVETAIVEANRPRLIREEGRMGRLGRTRTFTEYAFDSPAEGVARVELTFWTEPGSRVDAITELLGMRGYMKRRSKHALERLRRIFEEERARPLARASIAGWEPGKAARFGSPVQVPSSPVSD